MTDTWKTVLRAAAPVLALLVLALGVRLLPSALGSSDPGTSPAPAVPPRRGGAKPAKPMRAPIPVAPQQVAPETQRALQKVVTGQLTAFARNDFARALRFAAPGMRDSWSPDMFRQMVQSGYAPLLTYRRASFAPARITGATVFMPVVITDANGSDAGYLYTFHRTRSEERAAPGKRGASGPDEWYIDGVSPLPPGDEEEPVGPMFPSPPGAGSHSGIPVSDAQEA